MAKNLEYYFVIAKVIVHVIFDKYTIDENGDVRNKKTKKALRLKKDKKGYKNVGVLDASGEKRSIRVARAIASTFLGPPPTKAHTADHKDKNRANDTLENIRWATREEQRDNQDRLDTLKTAFLIVRDGKEKTNKEWVEYFNSKGEKNPHGREYTSEMISQYAKRKQHGFAYKEYPDLEGEVWKDVEGSKTKRGMWRVSNMNRVKYIMNNAENVFEKDRLGLDKGYPTINFNGKQWGLHVVVFMTFFPEEWANKKPDEMVCHKEDNKMDFRPEMLYLGTASQNGKDAHDNGKHDGTLKERQKCASYKDGVLEREYESQHAAAEYLRLRGFDKVGLGNICKSMDKKNKNGSPKIRYGRSWKRI